MDVAIVAVFSFFISSAVPKCIPHDIVTTDGTSLTYMMSASRVTFPCYSRIPFGRTSVVVTTRLSSFLLFWLE